MTTPQSITRATYEDPEVVEGYIQRNSITPKSRDMITTFSKHISGSTVLDLGCGPGHDSYLFHELGFTVTGLDYSSEMIRRAKTFKTIPNPPQFIVGDMTQLTNYFPPDHFDAVWASASLLHIPRNQTHAVLSAITSITKNQSPVYISLKGGSGEEVAEETKLGKTTQRAFTLWNKDEFISLAQTHQLQLIHFSENEGSIFLGQPTQWLKFIFKLSKTNS